jgi:hypothetical protein
VPNEDAVIAARRPLILWLIEHHPEHEMTRRIESQIFATSRDWLPDPEGYQAARAIWQRHAARPDVTTNVLGNAAWFLSVTDKRLAIELLRRAQSMDSAGPWTTALAEVYGQVLVGSNAFTLFNVVRSFSAEDAHGLLAQEVRAALAASDDAKLLTGVGKYLSRNAGQVTLDFDRVALARTYAERAARLDPELFETRALLFSLDARARYQRVSEIRRLPIEAQYEKVAALPETERLTLLPYLAEFSYMAGEGRDYYQKDAKGAGAAWDLAGRYSRDALTLAARHSTHPDAGTAIYKGNMTLSALAMREGDRRRAVEYMRAASEAPPSDDLVYGEGFASARPVAYLLKYGERQSVIDYLERMARTSRAENTYLLESAAAIRSGKMPSFYYAQIATR